MSLIDKIFDDYVYPSHPYVDGYLYVPMDPRDHGGRGYDKLLVYVDMGTINIPSEITSEMIGYYPYETPSFDVHISTYLDRIKSDITLTVKKYLKYIGMCEVLIEFVWISF
jgi:hypothetical protein